MATAAQNKYQLWSDIWKHVNNFEFHEPKQLGKSLLELEKSDKQESKYANTNDINILKERVIFTMGQTLPTERNFEVQIMNFQYIDGVKELYLAEGLFCVFIVLYHKTKPESVESEVVRIDLYEDGHLTISLGMIGDKYFLKEDGCLETKVEAQLLSKRKLKDGLIPYTKQNLWSSVWKQVQEGAQEFNLYKVFDKHCVNILDFEHSNYQNEMLKDNNEVWVLQQRLLFTMGATLPKDRKFDIELINHELCENGRGIPPMYLWRLFRVLYHSDAGFVPYSTSPLSKYSGLVELNNYEDQKRMAISFELDDYPHWLSEPAVTNENPTTKPKMLPESGTAMSNYYDETKESIQKELQNCSFDDLE